MMITRYVVHVQQPWFDFIVEGKKIYEGRLNRGKFSEMKIDDIVEWKNDDVIVITKIVEKFVFKSFHDMLSILCLDKVLPEITTISDGVDVYHEFYTRSDELKYGVVAIRLEIINN